MPSFDLKGFADSINRGELAYLYDGIRPAYRREHADLFRKNFDLMVEKLVKGKIDKFSQWEVNATCWVGPGKNLVDNPAADVNPLLRETKVAVDSEKSDYADKLAAALKRSQITKVELPATYSRNGVTTWATSQEDRNKIMAALPSTVKEFSLGLGYGGFTEKDLQNLTNLMERNPGMKVELYFSDFGNPRIGPFDDKTFENFVKATQKSDYLTFRYHGRGRENPLFVRSDGDTLYRKKLLGVTAVKGHLGEFIVKPKRKVVTRQRGGR